MTQEELQSLLVYAPDTGEFHWRKTGKGRRRDLIAGTVNRSGYVYINIGGIPTLAHRLAWLYVHGDLPSKQIDHINHDRSDNRIDNLRIVSNHDNAKNRKLSQKNTSGFTGVYWCKQIKKWKASIRKDGKVSHLGCSDSKEEMVDLRKLAEAELNYHPNHGS